MSETNFTTYIKWKTKLYQHLSLNLKMLPVHVILKIIHKNLQLLIVLFANVYQIDSDINYYMNQDWTLLEISFTTESAEQQATEMEKHEEHNINKVLPSKNDHKQYSKFSKTKPQSNSGQDEKKFIAMGVAVTVILMDQLTARQKEKPAIIVKNQITLLLCALKTNPKLNL